mgnify:CR=1 FL=1
MKKPIFAGAGVAIVTPFKDETLKINFPLFEELINDQIENGTDAIVVCGTTGEPVTMTEEERLSVIEYTVKRVAGRVPFIAGSGGNCTENTISFSKKA